MNTAKPLLPSDAGFDVFDGGRDTTNRMPDASALIGELRKAVAQVTQWVAGADAQLARDRYLAEASDPADLERRSVAWDRAQETRRSMPPVL
ncbi:hypothetical protein [Variovorax saccharolyticus]|uniref:hypothetical protein n=1 Tax=Variovorax saccharolyticus TaxID=3053516 RepID=UPI002576AD77|nr:hypothetical protein [Variovorax sp. J22R187]MDM0019050.1 hypothetical protein [Variovorax sp. J22R187]